MFKQISLIILSVVVSLYAVPLTSSVSPWEHSGSELTTSPTIIPGQAPIEYSGYFTREREMFDYKPRFMPTLVTFDKNNRPYLLTPVHPTNAYDGNQSAFETFSTPDVYIQTLDDSGDWIVYDVAQMFRDLYGSQLTPVNIAAGMSWEDRIAFDDENNIYFAMYESNRFSGRTVIYSRDNLETVQKLGLAQNYYATLEVFDSFLSSEKGMPTFSHRHSSSPMTITELRSDIFGNLMYDKDIVVAPIEGLLAPAHAGFVNHTVTVGEVIHCVWLDSQDQTEENYTRQYHSSYNRRTGEVSGPHYLGSTYGYWPEGANPADTHNGPTITVGKDKTLHVVLGAHNTQGKYTYSTDQGETWAAATDLPGGNSVNAYPTLITGRDGTVHLVYSEYSNGRKLSYSRKKAGQAWEDMGALVVPYWTGYSIYNHKMTVDRLGRLFVTYWYRAEDLTQDAIDAYESKWPGQAQSLPHDPVIIMSDNGGDSWKIATTADFAAGIIDDTIPAAVYNFDRAGNLGLDMAGSDNNVDSYGNPASVSGIYGDAVSFNGTTDGLKGSLNQAEVFEDGSFTVVGWFKPDTSVSGLSNLVNAKIGTNGFALSVNNGQWIGYTYADGYTDSVVASADTTAGQWKHIAFTYKADGEADANGIYTGTSKLYVDGSLIATQTGKKYSPEAATDVAIAMDTTASNFFACSVDEIGVFTGEMPEQKVVELAENTFRPQNVSRELLYGADFNQDGLINFGDLSIFTENWLATE